MAQSLANYDAALKNFYQPGIRNALNNSNPVLTEVVKDREGFSGRKCVWSIHSGRSTSTGARAEGAALPTADRQRFVAPEDTLAYEYHTIKVTGQAQELTMNNQGAFARALDQETQGAERDLKNDLARQMFNRAVTINSVLANGSLATVNGAPSGNVVTLDDGAVAYSNITRPFFVGELLDFINPSTGAVTAAARTITAISSTNGTITLDSVTSIVDNLEVFRAGNYASGENEINGLRYLIGSQTYATIDPTVVPVWQSPVVGGTTVGISENILESAIEKVQTDGDGSTPTLAVAEHSQGRKLASVIQQQKRYAPPSTKLEAGWTGIEVAGLNLVFDRYCPSTNIFVLTPSELAWFIGLDWTWDDTGGSVLYKALDDTDAVQARFKGYVNLQAYNRNSHAKITLADPVF